MFDESFNMNKHQQAVLTRLRRGCCQTNVFHHVWVLVQITFLLDGSPTVLTSSTSGFNLTHVVTALQ